MPGPNLAGLIGRKVAGDPNFDYSPVLRQARDEGRVWTLEALETFLADPEAMFPAHVDERAGHPRTRADRKALARLHRRSGVAIGCAVHAMAVATRDRLNVGATKGARCSGTMSTRFCSRASRSAIARA